MLAGRMTGGGQLNALRALFYAIFVRGVRFAMDKKLDGPRSRQNSNTNAPWDEKVVCRREEGGGIVKRDEKCNQGYEAMERRE